MAIVWLQEDLDAVKAAYLNLLTGKQTVRVRFASSTAVREFEYSRASLKDMRELMNEIALYLSGTPRTQRLTLRTSKGL